MDFLSALNLTQTRVMISSSIVGVWEIISVFVVSNPVLASLYPLLVLIMILINRSVYAGHKRVEQTFVYEVDRILYQAALALHRAKPTLVRRKEQLEVLYTHKKALFSYNPKTSGRNYMQSFGFLAKDIEYLEQLTQSVVISSEQQQQISVIKSYLQRSRILYAWIGGVVSVMTLGLYSLVQPSIN